MSSLPSKYGDMEKVLQKAWNIKLYERSYERSYNSRIDEIVKDESKTNHSISLNTRKTTLAFYDECHMIRIRRAAEYNRIYLVYNISRNNEYFSQ